MGQPENDASCAQPNYSRARCSDASSVSDNARGQAAKHRKSAAVFLGGFFFFLFLCVCVSFWVLLCWVFVSLGIAGRSFPQRLAAAAPFRPAAAPSCFCHAAVAAAAAAEATAAAAPRVSRPASGGSTDVICPGCLPLPPLRPITAVSSDHGCRWACGVSLARACAAAGDVHGANGPRFSLGTERQMVCSIPSSHPVWPA